MSTTRWPEYALPTTLLAMALLAGCTRGQPGPLQTLQRGVDAFHSIDLRGASDLAVQIAPETSVSITADAATLAATTTRVHNGMLIIEDESPWRWFGKRSTVNVRISMPALNSLSLNGAGNATIAGIRGDAVALSLQGAGNVTASGSTAALNARINGAGNMQLQQLLAGDATVNVNGTGNMSVHVTGALVAAVNGVGSITYAGQPTRLDTQVNGVGSISPQAVVTQ